MLAKLHSQVKAPFSGPVSVRYHLPYQFKITIGGLLDVLEIRMHGDKGLSSLAA